MQVTLSSHPWRVVVLEGDSLGFEGLNNSFDVISDDPARSGGTVRPRILRLINLDLGISALVDHHWPHLTNGSFQTERAFIELTGHLHALDCNRGYRVVISQHRTSL